MVAIVAGTSLGLGNTSFKWANGRAMLDTPVFGGDGTRIFINAKTGNLVIQRVDDELDTSGADVSVLRTYNSQGQLGGSVNGDGDDYWRNGLTSTLTTKEEVRTQYDAMNRQAFIWDSRSGTDSATPTVTHALGYDLGGQRSLDVVSHLSADGTTATTSRYSYVYSPGGLLIQTLQDGTLVEARDYDDQDRVVRLETDDATGQHVTTSWYNTAGDLTSEQRRTTPSGATQATLDYTLTNTYEGRRLDSATRWTKTGDNSGLTATEAYTYRLTAQGWQVATVHATSQANTNGSDGPVTDAGITRDVYDYQGFLIVSDNSRNPDFERYFDNNTVGQVLQINQNYGRYTLRNVIAGGQVLLSYGQQMVTDEPRNADGTPNIDTGVNRLTTGYQPIVYGSVQNPGSGPSSYRVSEGDTLQGIAFAAYGDASMWYLIANANGLNAGSVLAQGSLLVIPAAVQGAHNSAMTFTPYNAARYVANVTPYVAANAGSAAQGAQMSCAAKVGLILATVVIAAVAFFFTAGLASVAIGAVIGTELAATTTATVATAVVSSAIGGAVSSVAEQGFKIGVGLQREFSGTDVATGALGGMLFAGLGVVGSALAGTSKLAGQIANASFTDIRRAATMAQVTGAERAAGAAAAAGRYAAKVLVSTAGYTSVTMLTDAASQGMRMGTGEQDEFSWKELAAAAVSGVGLGAGVGLGLSRTLLPGRAGYAHAADFFWGSSVGSVGAAAVAGDGQLDPYAVIAGIAQSMIYGAAAARGASAASRRGAQQDEITYFAPIKPSSRNDFEKLRIIAHDGSEEGKASAAHLQKQLGENTPVITFAQLRGWAGSNSADGNAIVNVDNATIANNAIDLSGATVHIVGHFTPDNVATIANFIDRFRDKLQLGGLERIALEACQTSADVAKLLFGTLGGQTEVSYYDGDVRYTPFGIASNSPYTRKITLSPNGTREEYLGMVDQSGLGDNLWLGRSGARDGSSSESGPSAGNFNLNFASKIFRYFSYLSLFTTLLAEPVRAGKLEPRTDLFETALQSLVSGGIRKIVITESHLISNWNFIVMGQVIGALGKSPFNFYREFPANWGHHGMDKIIEGFIRNDPRTLAIEKFIYGWASCQGPQPAKELQSEVAVALGANKGISLKPMFFYAPNRNDMTLFVEDTKLAIANAGAAHFLSRAYNSTHDIERYSGYFYDHPLHLYASRPTPAQVAEIMDGIARSQNIAPTMVIIPNYEFGTHVRHSRSREGLHKYYSGHGYAVLEVPIVSYLDFNATILIPGNDVIMQKAETFARLYRDHVYFRRPSKNIRDGL